MKILIAPLNWGLGHATRCMPIIQKYIDEGHTVVIAGDGDSGILLKKYFPALRYIPLPHLELKYSNGNSQVMAMLRSLPKIFRWMHQDKKILDEIVRDDNFDLIISDNRFCFYSDKVRSIYITHQLMIKMPKGLRWLEPAVHRLHLHYIKHYQECLIPDYEDAKCNLSGDLSHKYPLPKNTRFIGPCSRFTLNNSSKPLLNIDHIQDIAILSGLEPQRSILEEQLLKRYRESERHLLIVRGLVSQPYCTIRKGTITLVPYLDDNSLRYAFGIAERIIARSGYSTIMDLQCLGVLNKAILIPTSGQTEQEYLASLHNKS